MERLSVWATSPLVDHQAACEAITYLRRRAERCRQLALQQFDAESTDELTRLARLFDQEAARIDRTRIDPARIDPAGIDIAGMDVADDGDD